MSIITLLISVKHIGLFMEGTGTLRILVTHLHLPITIFGVGKIHKMCIHTHIETHSYIQTHTNVKNAMVIYFSESC